jgi:hypothetical protein
MVAMTWEFADEVEEMLAHRRRVVAIHGTGSRDGIVCEECAKPLRGRGRTVTCSALCAANRDLRRWRERYRERHPEAQPRKP